MLRFETWDVFTDTPYTGNPLAIVSGAEGLTTAQMQTLAAEFNLSETIFLMPPEDPAHTARVRIFTPAHEMPFAGHPTVGAAVMLAGEAETATITLEEVAGLVPVTVTRAGDARPEAEFVAPVLPQPPGVAIDTDLMAAALGLTPADLDLPGHAPAAWESGALYALVPVASADALARSRVTAPAWDRLASETGVAAAYLYAPGADTDYRCRMFGAGLGVTEDPATGSAAVALASQLLASGALAEGTRTMRLLQGAEMGRPSLIGLTAEVTAGRLSRVRVSGTAVRVSSGEIRRP
jgi:trans-2,3-dihydro-3-hydroxyanthranilate isomerase